jgi:hypothetical protein
MRRWGRVADGWLWDGKRARAPEAPGAFDKRVPANG